MNFIASELTFLKFFIPIIEEGNRRGIKSKVFVSRSGKYSCPLLQKNSDQLKKISEQFCFGTEELTKDSLDDSPCFLVEGVHRNFCKKSRKRISLCCSTDFTALFDSYVNEVDHIVMNSRFVAERYKKVSEKNVYLGSPKFDLKVSRQEVEKKYNLIGSKRAIVFYPRSRDLSKSPVEKCILSLQRMGFEVILKSRGKDPISEHHSSLANLSLYDSSWYPPTSLELIVACDIVVNFSSSVIEETTFYRKPVINFHVKPFVKPLDFLYEYDFVKNVNPDFDEQEFIECCHQLTNSTSLDYEKARRNLLDSVNSSSDIIESLI